MSILVSVDIEDIADELEDAGWHHEDECGGAEASGAPVDLREALASLHRQAHPSQHHEPTGCREEPCRSLPMSVLQRPVHYV